jgi:hypothetical protein
MNPILLLVIGAVGLAGCVILLLLGLNMLRAERGAQNGEAAAGLATPQVAGVPPELAKLVPATPAAVSSGANPFAGVTARLTGGGARGSAHEVLRVLRDNLTGRLLLEIAGKRYAGLDDVGDGDVRQALMTTLHDLEVFAGGPLTPAAADHRAETQAAVATRQAVAARAARPAADQAPAEYKPLPAPSMNPFKQMAVLREIAKNPPPVLKSITEQIDDVLQARITGTPMIHRGLHVKPGPRGDAIFEADGQSYASVDELPDVEVRDVIRAAIADWEAKR